MNSYNNGRLQDNLLFLLLLYTILSRHAVVYCIYVFTAVYSAPVYVTFIENTVRSSQLLIELFRIGFQGSSSSIDGLLGARRIESLQIDRPCAF